MDNESRQGRPLIEVFREEAEAGRVNVYHPEEGTSVDPLTIRSTRYEVSLGDATTPSAVLTEVEDEEYGKVWLVEFATWDLRKAGLRFRKEADAQYYARLLLACHKNTLDTTLAAQKSATENVTVSEY